MKIGIYILLVLILGLSLYAGFMTDGEAYFLCEQINDCLKWLAISLLLHLLKFKYHLILSAAVFIMCTVEVLDEVTGRNIKNMPFYYNDYIVVGIGLISIIILSVITWQKSKKKY